MIEKQVRDQESHPLLASCKIQKEVLRKYHSEYKSEHQQKVLENRLQLPKIVD